MRSLEQQREPRRALSWALSVTVHLVFLAMLIFTVTWQRKAPEPVTVELWRDLPPAPAEKAPALPPPPPPKVEVKPPPPPPPPKVEPKPEPKPEPKEIEPPKPDIALKEKLEKEKLEKQKLEKQKLEQQKKLEDQKKLEEQKRLEDQKKLEKQKLEQARLEEQKRFEEIRQRDMRDIAAAQARRDQQAAATAASQSRADDAEAISRIRSRIRGFVVLPPDLAGNPEAEFDVVVLPGGEVLSVKLVKSSGVAAYDNAVERAILKAQPLPVPSDPAAFARFRNLHLKFRPNE